MRDQSKAMTKRITRHKRAWHEMAAVHDQSVYTGTFVQVQSSRWEAPLTVVKTNHPVQISDKNQQTPSGVEFKTCNKMFTKLEIDNMVSF